MAHQPRTVRHRKDYIENLLELPTVKIKLTNQALFLFEWKKIRNIQALKQGKASILSHQPNEGSFNTFLKKIVFFPKKYPQLTFNEKRLKAVFDKLAALSKKHGAHWLNTAISPL